MRKLSVILALALGAALWAVPEPNADVKPGPELAYELPPALVGILEQLQNLSLDQAEAMEQYAKHDRSSLKDKADRIKKDRDLVVKDFATAIAKEKKNLDADATRIEKSVEKLQERLGKVAGGQDANLEKQIAEANAQASAARHQSSVLQGLIKGAQSSAADDKDKFQGALAQLQNSLPKFKATLSDEGVYDSGDQTKPLVLVFFATNNSDSLRVVDSINQLATQYKGKDVDFVALAVQDTPKAIAELVAKRKWVLKCGVSDTRNSKVSGVAALHATVLPQTFVVGTNGKILRSFTGASGKIKGEAQKVIEDQLKPKKD
jgi:thiol-disulfide isomerase/thioredoxin